MRKKKFSFEFVFVNKKTTKNLLLIQKRVRHYDFTSVRAFHWREKKNTNFLSTLQSIELKQTKKLKIGMEKSVEKEIKCK